MSNVHCSIVPGILEHDLDAITQKIEKVRSFAHCLHVDVIDGIFAPEKTWMDPAPLAPFAHDFQMEAHLMVDNPIEYIQPFAKNGFVKFIGHVEKMPDLSAFLAKGEEYGEVGLALDIPTPLSILDAISLNDLDFIFLMGVHAGKSYQEFMPEVLTKIAALHEKAPWLPIEVDGGVTDETIVQMVTAGATQFVSTGFLFDAPDVKLAFLSLQEKIASTELESGKGGGRSDKNVPL